MKIMPAIALGAMSMLLVSGQAHGQPADAALASDYAQATKLLDEWEGERSQLEEARRLLLSIVARNRSHAPAFVGLSRLERKSAYHSFHNYDAAGLERARKFADHALKLDPNLYDAYIARAWVAIAQEDLDLAHTELDRAEEITPSTSAVKLARSEVAWYEGNMNDSARWANEVIAMPIASVRDRAEAYGRLVNAYVSLRDLDKADDAYQKQLKLIPNSAWAHGNYAGFLLRRGKAKEAVAEAERAVKLMPYPIGVMTLARAYVARADQLWEEKQYDAAASYIEKVTIIAGADADMYYSLGVFYERAARRAPESGALARAATAYRKSLELNPNHVPARKALQRLQQ